MYIACDVLDRDQCAFICEYLLIFSFVGFWIKFNIAEYLYVEVLSCS